jgi:hypothetical protein
MSQIWDHILTPRTQCYFEVVLLQLDRPHLTRKERTP